MFINFCQITTPEVNESLRINAFNIIEPYLDSNIAKGLVGDEYGLTTKANVFWQDASEYKFLIRYLFIIRDEILKDIQNCSRKTYSEYKEDFKLDCIKKHFSCQKIPFDVTPLYNLFGVGNPYGFDGISFMAISYDDQPLCNENNIFEVQPNNI